MTKTRVVKDVDYVTINFADNGYILEYSGQDGNADYANAKILVSKFEELVEALKVADKASSYKV